MYRDFTFMFQSHFPFFFIRYFLYLHFKCYLLSWFPLQKTPLSPPPLTHQPTHSCFLALAFPYIGAWSLHRIKGLFSHWWLTRLSSATYAAGDMSHTMCTLWLVVKSLGALGVLVSSYCCSSYGPANSFSSFGPFSSSFIGDPVLSPMDGYKHPLLYLLGIGRVSASTYWHPQ
jgi:hypothetical protein